MSEEEAKQRGEYAQSELRQRLREWIERSSTEYYNAQKNPYGVGSRSLRTPTQYSVDTGYPLTEEERKSVAECEAIYALEDKREG